MTQERWLPDDGAHRVALVHERTGHVVASSVQLALTRRARRTGLLGHAGLDPTIALVLAPCFMIHTAFMRFPIDVLFVSRDGRALHLVHSLKPWRVSVCAGAYAVIELAAGVLARNAIAVGDGFLLEEPALQQPAARIA